MSAQKGFLRTCSEWGDGQVPKYPVYRVHEYAKRVPIWLKPQARKILPLSRSAHTGGWLHLEAPLGLLPWLLPAALATVRAAQSQLTKCNCYRERRKNGTDRWCLPSIKARFRTGWGRVCQSQTVAAAQRESATLEC